MLNIGYAQEIITPPVGVGLAGYMNQRPNQGMYDDLYAKTVIFDNGKVRCGILVFDLVAVHTELLEALEKRICEKFGREFHDNLIICANHTHTGPEFRKGMDERTLYAFNQVVDGALRALERAVMNLQPGEVEYGSVYNNPYGFVRRYWMKNGTIVTNPGWCNPDIDRPESDFDRNIGIIRIIQNGKTAALICNIAQHGDTIGGSIVSADWYGRFAQEIQHALKASMPVLVVDDASGDINHFDFRQKINQSSYDEAVRIGRGYAAIVLNALGQLEKLNAGEITVKNSKVTIPHRKLTPEEVAEAQHTLDTVPDIPKEGDFESQDLANKVPAALRFFAQRALDCHHKSTPSHDCRLTAIEFGKELAFVSLPGEPFNGIGRSIREKSPFKNTFIVSLAQSQSGYVPMAECFPRGGYEVQPGINTAAPEAAGEIIKAALENL
ncbi:MAG: neutral/alkaline non-lysosomal ceramidase N-terminal domain-containing protein [Lentisphaeria bacterium]|nr:neutral/alkaline non-lysosomal ceramidase N-terminal domain-containing protein [Lentisphaeria bacterium]